MRHLDWTRLDVVDTVIRRCVVAYCAYKSSLVEVKNVSMISIWHLKDRIYDVGKKGVLCRVRTEYCYCDPFLGQWILSGV